MCLILFSLASHPKYKLIIAANRDEFFNRKTSVAHFWNDFPDIVGGRDLEAHGTWMAMTREGRIAMVTNYRDPHHIRANAPSRGQLVTDYLTSQQSPRQYLEALAPHATEYNGFNLLVGDQNGLAYFSNYARGIIDITPGIHGLSNHLLDTSWPKVVRGTTALKDILVKDEVSPDSLFEILHDERRAPIHDLPDTGIGAVREEALSSMFIRTDGYGTRCSTIVLITHENEVTYAERTYSLDDRQTQMFAFELA